MQKSQIKLCTEKDIPTIIHVAIQSYNEHYLHYWYDEGAWYKQQSFNPETLKQEMLDVDARFYLLYDAGTPVGFLKLNLHKKIEPYTDAECLELERIYIIKAGAGKGLGKQAVNFTLDIARSLNKKYIWLKGMDASPSMFFYESTGFEKIGTLRLDYELMKEEFRGMIVYLREVLSLQ